VISWPLPFIPALPGTGGPVRVFDTATGRMREAAAGPVATMYVCGITPYDATHLGHAATYVTFDVLGRALRDSGRTVRYVQNVTDVDDPLLERAARDGVPWQDLAAREVALFREDMTALRVVPPEQLVGVVESVERIAVAVRSLLEAGAAYRLTDRDAEGDDVYFDVGRFPAFGSVSHLGRRDMLDLSAERGGDPDRPGKRDPLDPLLWRAARAGEPSWQARGLGPGRPGWHMECTSIALDHLGMGFDLQGGGTDLVFPHHEMSALQAVALTGEETFARCFVHQAMVGLGGEKMSKSKGNLVLVSRLRAEGVDPMAIRLALLGRHYRTAWDWSEEDLKGAQQRLDYWRAAVSVGAGPAAHETVAVVRERVAADLDTPGALEAVDRWARACLAEGGDDTDAPGLVGRLLDALLGVCL
jgi:L-cysteine:1D-myo-inositol 2-amino-2-deoxy-alpha-D-glucopyranoside ligase